MSTFLEIHAIQSLPPSNVNRDEVGAPKSAIYGGKNRARVSSQSWKRATRLAFQDEIAPALQGTRTKRVVELLSARIVQRASLDAGTAAARASEVLQLAGIKVKEPRLKKDEVADPATYVSEALVFLSSQQLDQLADLAVAETMDKAQAKKAIDTEHGVDVALFGRMVASAPQLNVDAAVQVAHAISTHSVEPQSDFYTAVDDHRVSDEEDKGAGMVGTIDFASATLYRYAAVALETLRENIGSDPLTAEAAAAFVRAFLTSMPSGKKNSMAADTLPELALVMVRQGRPISLVGAFEEPIRSSDQGYARPSVTALLEHARLVDSTYGTTPVRAWCVSLTPTAGDQEQLGERVTLPALIDQVRDVVPELVSPES